MAEQRAGMKMRTVKVNDIEVSQTLYGFIEHEVLPGTGIDGPLFWSSMAKLLHEFGPRNRELLGIRDKLQLQIDEWHLANRQRPHDPAEYGSFLQDIGYLRSDGPDFEVTTSSVDEEIAQIAGPQLVVPVSNARYSINAANARWGSLYDALYGTDAISGKPDGEGYDAKRGEHVVNAGRSFLDSHFPLTIGSHADVTAYKVSNALLVAEVVGENAPVQLRNADQFTGYVGDAQSPERVLLTNNGLGVELLIDHAHIVGRDHPAGLADILLEAALTTICDLEDSVAAVDPQDKVAAYRNWLGLMKGDISETFTKSDKTITRELVDDREYIGPNGQSFTRHGRALLLIRNVGLLMEDHSILDRDGRPAMEGLVDGLVTSLIALHDLKGNGRFSNSRKGSIYIVKPKMHGPDEVAFSNDVFDALEDALRLPRHTIKMGIMDEERRTSVNLKECIRAARHRVFFINTGFLDRTGDEIRTSMEAGPVIPKMAMKDTAWIRTYENRNVDIGLSCGFPGHAQIGKGMWAMPDLMSDMLVQKRAHPEAGATTAWVPSPTAATLHATHYHEVAVQDCHPVIAARQPALLDELLKLPLAGDANWTAEEVARELENNAQSILGYVVRWIDQGIGCSKVPDINDIGLMEDRATLRISSQHMANWIHHGVCSEEQVMATLKRMALVVDRQNADDPNYNPMSPDLETNVAFAAACDLVFKGGEQPNGYTEPVLHRRRLEAKASSTEQQ